MRKLLLTASLLALASAGALAQAPQGVVPTTAVPQRTEPGRYWVFFAWNRAELPPDGRKVRGGGGAVVPAHRFGADLAGRQRRPDRLPRLQREAVGAAGGSGARRARPAGGAGRGDHRPRRGRERPARGDRRGRARAAQPLRRDRLPGARDAAACCRRQRQTRRTAGAGRRNRRRPTPGSSASRPISGRWR